MSGEAFGTANAELDESEGCTALIEATGPILIPLKTGGGRGDRWHLTTD